MKWIVFLFFIYGCYLPKTAEKQLDKAQKKYPEIVAKKAQELYPVKTDSVEFIRWKTDIDTFVKLIELDHFIVDTFTKVVKVESYQKRYEFQRWINRELVKKISEIKPIIIKDSAESFRLRDALQKAEKERDKFRHKFSILSWIVISFLILFILYLVAYILKK
jgi:hypothetical protein